MGRLPLTELSAAAEALATLERLASEGLIGFEMGVARVRKTPKQTTRPIQPQEQALLDAMTPGTWMSAREIAAAMPTIPANSLSPRLATMAENEWIEISRRGADRLPGTPGRRAVNVYRRPLSPKEGSDPDFPPSSSPPPGGFTDRGEDEVEPPGVSGSGPADPPEAGEP
ncbi:hypothetical protein [Methylobacterium fujisawaense]